MLQGLPYATVGTESIQLLINYEEYMNKNIMLFYLAIIIIINSCQNKKYSEEEITKYNEPEYVLKSVSDNPKLIELDNLFRKVRNKEIPAVDFIKKCEELLENFNDSPNELVYVQFQYALALIIENRLKEAETILLKSIEKAQSNNIENRNDISVSIYAVLSKLYLRSGDVDKAIKVNKDIIENYYNLKREYNNNLIEGYYSVMGLKTLSGILTQNKREQEGIEYFESLRSKNLNFTTSHAALSEIYNLQMFIGDTINAKLSLEKLISEQKQNKDIKFVSDEIINRWVMIKQNN